MKIKRKMEIEIRQNKILFMTGGKTPSPAECPACGSGMMMPVDHAMQITRLTSRQIHRAVESGGVHFQETPAGRVLVCSSSLAGNQEEYDE